VSIRHVAEVLAGVAVVGFALLGGTGCWNGSHDRVLLEAGGRFALEIETGRSDLVGTHFLLDTATGDLWRLDVRGAGSPIWVRVADGPSDARPLERVPVPAARGAKDGDDAAGGDR
jgi:hypothetical protein